MTSSDGPVEAPRSAARNRPWWRPTCGAAGCLLLLVALPGLCVWTSGESARRHARARAQVRAGMTVREALAVGDAEGMTRLHLEPSHDAAPRHRVVRHRDRWGWHEPSPHEPEVGSLDEVARAFEQEVATVTTVSWSLVLHWPSPGWDLQGPDLILPLELADDDVVRVGTPGR